MTLIPVQCACDAIKTIHRDFMRNMIVISCECGTVIRVAMEDAMIFNDAAAERERRESRTMAYR